jgi:hypothetical protein
MFNAPIGSGVQIFLIIVLVIIGFVHAVSVVDYLKIKEKKKEKED